ncbi:NAD(P)-dependent oxidoreductase [Oceanobacter mangrovi]|uniref:NAD(P)-dependent oxidoreductase n=1 Tax=Oceanobacter mangrovi TaxID=2862510 RepID=UPI001C8ED793|nr:NAD(P)-dependent oxidoreductase [Oceanobacter mangrovi]
MDIAFIGLGTMGYPMAGHLAKNGHNVTVYNRSPNKAENWINEFYGSRVTSPAEASLKADILMLCVGRDEDVEEMICGAEGILRNARPGQIIIDHTTTSSALAERMSDACQQAGVTFVDAPVSGGQQGAINGQLSVMVGCSEEVYAKVVEATNAYTKTIARIGNVGSGQKAKMVNQICIAGLVQGLAEGLHFAQQNDLDIETLIPVISQGAAGSWQMQNRYKTMINNHYDHGFAIDWMRKDLGICLQQARNVNASLPVTALVDQFYAELQGRGEGRSDTSVLLKRLQRKQD